MPSPSGHTLSVTIDAGSSVRLRVECHQPAGAPCRLVCDEQGCEQECGHQLGDAGRCLAAEWIDASGDVAEAYEPAVGTTAPARLYDGMPVEVGWDGDEWTWRPHRPRGVAGLPGDAPAEAAR